MKRIALIGCGRAGEVHAETVSDMARASIVAFCDVIVERAKEYSDRFGGEYATSDADRIFEDASIDAVYICVPHDKHADLSIRAVESGKHVLLEKPLAMNDQECREIVRTVADNDVYLMPAFKMRFFELVEKATELIPNPTMVTMQMMDDRWPDDFWANDPVEGGGNILSQGTHSTDLLRYVAGSDPVSVAAEGANYYQSTGVVDNMAAVYQFENGVTANLVQGDSNCPSFSGKLFLQVFDEGKSVAVFDRFRKLIYDDGNGNTEVIEGEETGYVRENRAFLAALDGDRSKRVDYRDGVIATLMILRALESIEQQKTIEIGGEYLSDRE